MARPLRVDFDGAWHHVMVQGHCKRPIFRNDQDRLFFLSLLAEIHARYGIEIHAYALMDNHFHLVIRTPRSGISRAMQYLNGQYARRFNAANGRLGALYRGRFKSILVTTDEYLVELPRYVHRNPVKAGTAQTPLDARWTSHRAYLGLEPARSFLYCTATLDYFGGDRDAFDRFVEAPDTAAARAVIELLGAEDNAPELESTVGEPAGNNSSYPGTAAATPIGPQRKLEALEDLVRLKFELPDDLQLRAVPGSGFLPLSVLLAVAVQNQLVDLDYLANRYGFLTRAAVRSTARRAQKRCSVDPRVASLLEQALALSQAA